ncbi:MULTISPECIES: aldehyde dehydrogenase family protein [Bacillus]|uniref:Aldehyde dehydrogenase n=1 Tax=Bacillus pseudomycoides TaxID=64104 RepID=A0AAJ1YUN5_9BACI|nr:aldehyde dehydrogenase family protein [Bacillus pseudomycoides]KFN13132.1 aldehyde dehydrogenase family protein [Bacillus pseudomycoides]MDR4186222.1 aldehyde dehydrogenase family protein [Bacillus pseudomycoides]MDR4324824.1 aldehyde dehydrogenase family protein [Bacillus pseudomycoides]MED0856199.1 aldehyde dehydrogenase family protein [Bacillus pseudomycoides]MED1535034.1 aldehyde dehydrogenase family protein [Bacillus pseudomycoides]
MLDLKMYLNGEWRDSSNQEKRPIINPANGKVIAYAPEGTIEDAKYAIEVARATFDSGIWSETSAAERASYLFKIADEIDKNLKELARLETMDNGKTYREAEGDIGDAAACFRYYAGLITKPDGQTYHVADPMQAMVVREPVGVCGLIVPWNYPLLMSVWKIAPALAAGNTIVFKPSEVTPITVMKLFEIMEKVELPKGVANMVMGAGPIVGNEIAASNKVDMISFTGGTKTGKHIMRTAADNMKKISLELGGKSPNIIFADADFETAVDYALFGIYAGAGQVCSAGSRILVEESVYDRFVNRFVERAKQINVGPGDNPESEMGPLVSQEHMEKVLRYIEIGKDEGAEIVCGGKRILADGKGDGFFIEPTVFVNVKPDMRIVQEEIFGPVVVIQKFKDEQEAIELANGTDYGLAGGVFTVDGAKAMRVIRKLRAGITWINSYHPTYNEAPWGGYKQSGIGRSLGTFGLEEFQEIKQININLEVEPIGWFANKKTVEVK